MSLPRVVRKTFFWLHLSAGLSAGLIILLLGITGTLLTYERQILGWFDGYKISVPQGRAPMPLEALALKMIAGHPDPALTVITREAGPEQPFVFTFGREKQLFINPYTSEVLGEGSPQLRGFFSFVTGLHRWLALQGDQRETGKTITGASSLFFLFLILSGLWLWWPKRWTWQHLKRTVLFQSRLHGPARDWNWHNVLGFWLCLPLLIITLTGAIMSYDWANHLLHRLAGTPPPPAKTAGNASKTTAPLSLVGLNQAWSLAEAKVADWQSINVRLPANPAGIVTFTISESHRGRADLKSQLMVHLKTGEAQAYETFSSYPRGKQWRFWVRWIHTGEAGGVWGQTLAGIAALGAVFLVWTGFALAWRRFKRRR